MMELHKTQNTPMTYDEVSMERSKSFVKALQELKNLRPQLYSAADYCEKSYLHSEQKQMVLDNLKDYAVRALVNAVDHLGTVAYKLTDLLDQQTLDCSTMEVKVSCLNQVIFCVYASIKVIFGSWYEWMASADTVCEEQKILTCKTYADKEGLRQQQLLAFIPRHHKHYVLPNSVNKKVHFSPHAQTGVRQKHLQAASRLQPSGSPASKTLSWHLASETKSTLKVTPHPLTNFEDPNSSGKSSPAFHLLDKEENMRMKSSGVPSQIPTGGLARNSVMQTFGIPRREMESSKPLTTFRSFENPRREIVPVPARSKSMLSAFFVKQKTPKLKASPVS